LGFEQEMLCTFGQFHQNDLTNDQTLYPILVLKTPCLSNRFLYHNHKTPIAHQTVFRYLPNFA